MLTQVEREVEKVYKKKLTLIGTVNHLIMIVHVINQP